jgi:hypothetical protein
LPEAKYTWLTVLHNVINVINMMKLRRYEGEAGHVAGIGKTTWEDEAITLSIIQVFR